MPPLDVPSTIGEGSPLVSPDCCQASWAANNKSLAARSILFSSRRVKSVTGNVAGRSTWPAILTRCRETSNRVTGLSATRPARNPSEFAFQPVPKAVTTPAPVTTTRRGDFGFREIGDNTAITDYPHRAGGPDRRATSLLPVRHGQPVEPRRRFF